MGFAIGVLVMAGFLVVGGLLQEVGEGLLDDADHPVVKVLGAIIMVIGLGIGAVITVGMTNAAQPAYPDPYPTYRFTYPR
jgi:hypothetical protein